MAWLRDEAGVTLVTHVEVVQAHECRDLVRGEYLSSTSGGGDAWVGEDLDLVRSSDKSAGGVGVVRKYCSGILLREGTAGRLL